MASLTIKEDTLLVSIVKSDSSSISKTMHQNRLDGDSEKGKKLFKYLFNCVSSQTASVVKSEDVRGRSDASAWFYGTMINFFNPFDNLAQLKFSNLFGLLLANF
ncbi:hypothetical protein T07_6986 [Trichinella nelsoni]|uniref:Uncharacterized protein n=1 Tax=Trichinella nelsoni TaxID=6336 RepID=A0A0V0S3H7_9BILA|nr:hypothetical protein T07_6986 [Trichinella nelsoni]